MAINLQPPFDVLPAYRPIAFETFLPSPDPQVIENAVVTILKGGVAIGPPIRYKSSRTEVSILPGFTDYYFEIDIQKYVQDTLGPEKDLPSTFISPATFGTITNIDLFDDYQLSITYELISTTTGLLEPFIGATDVTNFFNIYANTRQHQQVMDLDLYVGIPITQDTLFLTNSAKTLKVCEDNQAFLSFIQPNIGLPINGLRVELFDVNGVLLTTGTTGTLAPAFSAMQSVNSGIPSLTTQLWIPALGVPNFADPALHSYTVDFGYFFTFPGPTYAYFKQTEVFTYEVDGKCCGKRELRFHYMNLLGGVDSYTFSSEKDLIISTTSDRAQAALPWVIGSTTPHNINDVGHFKIKSEASTAFQVTSKFLTNTEATWLAELLASPKVYVENENSELVPVIIEDTNQSIDRHTGKIKFVVTATLANDWIIQRI